MRVNAVNRWVRRAAYGAAATLVVSVAQAAPVLRSATMRFGGSPRLPSSEWAHVVYVLENPDPQPVTVQLSLRAAEGGRSVYEKLVTIPPGATVRAREPVTADSASDYTLSIFLGDERIQREQIVVGNVDATSNALLLFINDNTDFAAPSELLKTSALREPVAFSTVMAQDAPSHWSGYCQARAVVIGRPRYRDLTAAQFGALWAYVERGGSVLFASPEGTLDVLGTPWEGLLPVVPLRIRQAEALPELDAWGAALGDVLPGSDGTVRVPLADRDGFPVLESTSCGDGTTILQASLGPVIRWRRCGLGRVGIVATDPGVGRIVRSGVFAPLWNHLLCVAQPSFSLGGTENSYVLPTVLSHLTGFTIPSAGVVGGVLLGYVSCLAAVLVGGFLWRRHVLSWSLAAALGILLTTVIFAWAFRQTATRSPRRAAIFDLGFAGERRVSGHSVLSLFTSEDVRPEIRALAGNCQIRALPSPARGKRREPLDAPLIVNRAGDLAELPGIAVQALRPREFAAEYEALPQPVTPIAMLLGERGASFAAEPSALAQLPAGADLYLLTGNDLVPVSRGDLRGGALGRGSQLLAADPFLNDVRRYVTLGSFPRPALVSVQRWEEGRGRPLAVATPGFTQDGYAIGWFPVALEAEPGPIHVPPEVLRVEPLGAGGRMLAYFDAGRDGSVLKSQRLVKAFEVALPPVLSELQPEQVTVDLDYANAGGNLTAQVRLLRVPAYLGPAVPDPEAAALWEQGIPASAVDGDSFRFDGSAIATLVRPAYARFRLLVQLSQKQLITASQDAERANRWRINRLNVTVDGSLPQGTETRKL